MATDDKTIKSDEEIIEEVRKIKIAFDKKIDSIRKEVEKTKIKKLRDKIK